MTTNNDNGNASEAIFVYQAYKRGWNLAKPFSHAQSYDFVVKMPSRSWETVQVKTIYLDKQGDGKKVRSVGVRRSLGRQYTEGDFDWLFAASETDCWLIPWSAMSDKKSVIVLDSPKWNIYLLPPV